MGRKFEIVSKYMDIKDKIRMPRRATKFSACYDIFNNIGSDIVVKAGELSVAYTTHMKIQMESDEVCKVFVRSGHGFKYSLKLANNTGIIDCAKAGTKLTTPTGYTVIEKVKVSDIITSYNESTKSLEDDIVSAAWTVDGLDLVEIQTTGSSVTVPTTKQVMTSNGWIEVKDLSLNDVILTENLDYQQITSIRDVESEKIYHITVKKNHNFFGNGLCLHNCDYYNNTKNEGECFVKFHNQGTQDMTIKAGEAMAQAMFQKYLLTDDDTDTVGGDRMGGFGSTSGT